MHLTPWDDVGSVDKGTRKICKAVWELVYLKYGKVRYKNCQFNVHELTQGSYLTFPSLSPGEASKTCVLE